MRKKDIPQMSEDTADQVEVDQLLSGLGAARFGAFIDSVEKYKVNALKALTIQNKILIRQNARIIELLDPTNIRNKED